LHPLAKDEAMVDYEIDSDEEYENLKAEQEGEDVSSKPGTSDDEDE